ncbi:Nramp family divalent metal transporter [bacterium]|nr:Nramp family divalent metal transporter [bacterium]
MSASRLRDSGLWKSIGPGLIWAAAAIGVSHLVQSTRAGAGYGFALVGVVILANLLKYPFFEFGPRYAAATGESLLEGYTRLGRWGLWLFVALTILTMFTIQAVVTVVTAALATQVFHLTLSPFLWSLILLVICAVILIPGKYPLLDSIIKVMILVLFFSTIFAVIAAAVSGPQGYSSPFQTIKLGTSDFAFLVALVGWMPSAIDISVWHSIWTLERIKQTSYKPQMKESAFDFNLGYIGTAIFSLLFISLGALIMFDTGEVFAKSGGGFAAQLLDLYSNSLGGWSRPVIEIAAFTAMFSTTLTVLDAFPRVLRRTTALVIASREQVNETEQRYPWMYWMWMIVVAGGALGLLSIFGKRFTFMIDLATTLSFLTAPILSVMNYKVVTGKNVPIEGRPPVWLKILSWIGIIFATGFAVLYLVWRFVWS